VTPALETFLASELSYPIIPKILHISEVFNFMKSLLCEEYDLESAVSEEIVEKHVRGYIDKLKPDLYVVAEYPYVDKIYRDTYYSYYSSKLNRHYRDCVRLSFFKTKIELDDFRSPPKKDYSEIKAFSEESYLGFLVIRPTFPKIIGRNCISPKAKTDDNFVSCLANIDASVNSIKQKVLSFPHASQDSQTMTCAETTVWSLFEYFGNKYPEYKPLLMSNIARVMQRFSYKRLLPSEGLTAEQITFAIREFGFGAMIHSKAQRAKSEFDLNYVISTYVESGIPIVGVLRNDEIGHAVNIIGRENYEPDDICKSKHHIEANGSLIIDFNRIDRKYVFIDDNHAPYQITTLHEPCKSYYHEARWATCEITNIIVPLHNKVYLDAARASKNFYQVLNSESFGPKSGGTKVLKIFLASTRSYKQYLALNNEINVLVREFILSLSMPKFIWIAEISTPESFLKGECDDIYIQDATEPSTGSEMLSNTSLLMGYIEGKVFVQNFGKFSGFDTFAHPFSSFKENLK
jgi:hypothetical protein